MEALTLQQAFQSIQEINEKSERILGVPNFLQILQLARKGRFTYPTSSLTRAKLYNLDDRLPFHDESIEAQRLLNFVYNTRSVLLPKSHKLTEDSDWNEASGEIDEIQEQFRVYRLPQQVAMMHTEEYVRDAVSGGTLLDIQSRRFKIYGATFLGWQQWRDESYALEVHFGNRNIYSIEGRDFRELSFYESKVVIALLSDFANEAGIQSL